MGPILRAEAAKRQGDKSASGAEGEGFLYFSKKRAKKKAPVAIRGLC